MWEGRSDCWQNDRTPESCWRAAVVFIGMAVVSTESSSSELESIVEAGRFLLARMPLTMESSVGHSVVAMWSSVAMNSSRDSVEWNAVGTFIRELQISSNI